MNEAIWNAYEAVYEFGDDGLDALAACPVYTKWLMEGDMEEQYLEDMDDADKVEMLAELEAVAEQFELAM